MIILLYIYLYKFLARYKFKNLLYITYPNIKLIRMVDEGFVPCKLGTNH